MDRRERILESGRRIAVLCGGSGSEREVSLVSGQAVEKVLREISIACDRYDLERDALPSGLDPERHLVLPVIHGKYGEGGRLSAELELGGFMYAGSDQASSVLCFDKLASKTIATRLGIPVARDYLIQNGEAVEFTTISTELGGTFILKPRFDGSSVGLYLVHSRGEFDSVQPSLEGRDYLAEEFISGCDLSVGLLDGEVLGIVGIHPEGGLYDYEHKYTAGMSRYEVPANLPGNLQRQLAGWARDLFRTCGCRDIARVDFRMGDDGKPVCLEINTLPGMTPTSLFPKTASIAGLDFGELILEWIGCALDRTVERSVAP